MDNMQETVAIFAMFSFFGYLMECLVIRKEKGYFENRGMATGPFLPIYGVAVILFTPLFEPIEHSYLLIFLLGAVLATVFEFTVGRLMEVFFGRVWWDYHEKPLNYKGIICLESTIAWGVIAVIVVKFALKASLFLVGLIPPFFLPIIAIGFPLFYGIDLVYTTYEQRKEWNDEGRNQEV